MIEVMPQLFVGTVDESISLVLNQAEWSIVNTSGKYHKIMHNWKKADPEDKCYILHSEPSVISINWVDAADPSYFNYNGEGVENVKQILKFIESSIEVYKKVLVCCDKGKSRSPSIAMMYMAFSGKFDNDAFEYESAKERFSTVYPLYNPGIGIETFLKEHWKEIFASLYEKA